MIAHSSPKFGHGSSIMSAIRFAGVSAGVVFTSLILALFVTGILSV